MRAVRTYPVDLDLVKLDEVDSTNDELRRILQNRPPSSSCSTLKAVLALRQTQGRGRLGRRWESPPGGLYFSLALEVPDASERVAALSLIVALAIRKELAQLAELLAKQGQTEPQDILVKWPNDLICPQGKLAGILIELVRLAPDELVPDELAPDELAPKQQYALVGVGINLARPNAGASEKAAYLSDFCSETPDREQTVKQIIESIVAYYAEWKAADCAFAHWVDEYNAKLSLIGREATASNGEGEVLAEGCVQGVNNSGSLLLLGEKGILTEVDTGEVTLRQSLSHFAPIDT